MSTKRKPVRPSLARRIAGAVLILLFLPLQAAVGELIYGVHGNNQLVSFDTDTLQARSIGTIGPFSIAGLTTAPDGTLYGLAVSNPSRLVRINPATGLGTVVGSTGVDGDLGAGFASDPRTGLLYAGLGQIGQKLLITISPETGAGTVVAPVALSFVGLEFDASGQLWALDGNSDRLARMDKTTGAFVFIGSGLRLPAGIGALTIGASGTFWAVDTASGSNLLYRIDPATGVATLQGTLLGIPFAGPMIGLAAGGVSVPADTDGDGLPDDEDACPESDLAATVIADGCVTSAANQPLGGGCTMNDRLLECATGIENHGDYVGCIVHLTRIWKQDGLISGREGGEIKSCAGQADEP